MRNKTTSDYGQVLKLKIAAISLLVALTGWIVPAKTVSQTKPLVFNSQNKQVKLQKESVIYKTDGPKSMAPTGVAAVQPNKRNYRPSENKKVVQISGQSQRLHEGRIYSKEAVKALIIKYSNEYGISPEVPLCIAYAESGFNANAKNRSSSASGVFQYLTGTWKGTDEGKAGLSVFDADSNVKAAVKYMASRKSTQPWEVRRKCPSL